MSLAAQTSGPIVYAPCRFIETTWTATKSTAGSNTQQYTQTPPVYIQAFSVEGAVSVIVDNGAPTDTDGDGIADSTDPDDDNDGRPDTSDDFPLDGNEKDDFDNDGVGDNADLDDDGDGTPDATDDAPYDPGTTVQDTDGDGVGDALDEFPTHGREDKDTDGDGIGDNQDVDDATPPPSGGGSPPPVGDGSGNPGTGDGGGGPGPVPLPGDTPGESGTAGTGDTSGKILPGAQHDIAGKALTIVPALQGKLGTFSPLGVSVIPRATTANIAFTTTRFGSFNYVIDFTVSPWTHVRTLLFIIMLYLTGKAILQRLTI
jgi:hypothetical protein